MTAGGTSDDGASVPGLVRWVRREPLTFAPETPVRVVLTRLTLERGDIAVVVDLLGRPLGVLTLRDVIERTVLQETKLDAPVAAVMTGGVITLPDDGDSHQARLLLARHDLRHLVLTGSDGVVVGVVTRADLYASRFPAVDDLVESIQSSTDVVTLAAVAQRIRGAAVALIDDGEGSGPLGEWIAMLNDLVALAAIDIAEEETPLPIVPWCWLAFGSEGRLEQTLATDQDNGLIFLCPDGMDVETLRAAFLPFARRVNEILNECGFPLCKGGVMAGNPRWCLSDGEWRACFAEWMRAAGADDLLNATIFFDFRPLAGDWRLADGLRRWLLDSAAETPLFLRFMTSNALAGGPPLGRIRDFAVDRASGRIDLKRDGSRLFVDAARILALALGIADTATTARLRAAGLALRWDARDTKALLDAFDFIQGLRLRSQRSGGEEANRVVPDNLSELERAFLKEAFRQARRLQEKLRFRYQL